MIKKVLIANRGEIACRIIKTLRQMGIASVAVYSAPDKNALHVSMADNAVALGGLTSAESYLLGDLIIQTAIDVGADAIHPGYGFLSENPGFVRSCQQANITFIGPDAESIEAMGLKDAAKKLMVEAGVPVVPGYHGDNQDTAFLSDRAAEIGYPVLIKARAGGGGKGMRMVTAAESFEEALVAAQREGAASFSDSHVLIEKFVSSPRHIEIQVFGDRHGNVVHLNERDCSLQRRHQKVIEEAPAPGMTSEMREAMGYAAVQAAQTVNYVGAGTVEFIVDASDGLRPDRFYFMEMNTRLQVEHPVTEYITGVDLVQWQLDVASGKPLPLSQAEIPLNGHSFEARIYAEDTNNGFLPATGTLNYLRFDQTARIDTGVLEGDTISPYYDPMIAKLIVHGRDRTDALKKLTRALSNCYISGCITNLGFLGRLAELPRFTSGDVETGLIEQEAELLKRNDIIADNALIIAGLFRSGLLIHKCRNEPWPSLTNWRSWASAEFESTFQWLELQYKVKVMSSSPRHAIVAIGNNSISVDIDVIDENYCELTLDGRRTSLYFFAKNNTLDVFYDGESYTLIFDDPLEVTADGSAADNQIVAPMPGQIISIQVKVADTVEKDDVLIIMEAMKMEHSLRANKAGTIESVNVSVGDQVEAGAILLSLELVE